ncbi:ABC transporter substrate-binding protein [Paenibacillus sp. HWE-109]|uniref:ABC transporter substrate-binding protein n=1 Tax=Paenibacillus sp. HWE-109 TaxID=1306526 RepID=UPI001EDD099B|nr:ABC transporter substrate-binding protein [Paenibacillus sp. HWE-109]UKS28157.1 ABC transporter substrate-binding protein [Paenibacillus sp. HWE-109]
MHFSKLKTTLLALTKLIMTMSILLLFFGCEQAQVKESANHVEEDNRVVSIATPIRKEPVLGFSQLGSESEWRIANSSSIKNSAIESDVKLIFQNAEQSQEKQIEAIREFVKQKVDVIAIAPVVETGWDYILKEVKQAGIPVIIIDRLVDVTDPSLYVTHIGSDFYEEGRKAGKYLLDKLPKSNKPIGIVELKGTEGSTPSIARGKGFRDVISSRTDLQFLKSENADFTVAKGKEVMKKFLKEKGRDIRVLYSHNDDMTFGALEAIEEYGLVPGKDIVVITVDGTRKALEKMNEGKINLVVECNPLLGPNLIQAVKEVLKGSTLPKRIVTPENVFTQVTAAGEIATRSY